MMEVLVENSQGRFPAITARKPKGLLVTLLVAFTLTAAPSKKQEPISDDRIHDQVLLKLAGDVEVKGGGIEVDVRNGVVTLKGKVEKEKQRTKAERLVKKIKGVTGVENQLVLSPK